MGPSVLGQEGRERRGQSGPHLAGVPALRPSTKHVIFDDPGVAVPGRIALVLPLTVIVFHNGDCHFPQVVGWRQRHCGEKSLRTKAGGLLPLPTSADHGHEVSPIPTVVLDDTPASHPAGLL